MATLGKSGNSLLTPISDSSWISSTRESGSSRHSSRTCDSGGSAGPTGRLSSARPGRSDLWPQLFSDVNCIALWISSEKILTRLYSVLHWFHKRLEANVKNPRENRCFQTIIVFSFGSFYNSNKCTVLWKIAASLITVITSVNKEMWVMLSSQVMLTSVRHRRQKKGHSSTSRGGWDSAAPALGSEHSGPPVNWEHVPVGSGHEVRTSACAVAAHLGVSIDNLLVTSRNKDFTGQDG